jgi:hypothetical protein
MDPLTALVIGGVAALAWVGSKSGLGGVAGTVDANSDALDYTRVTDNTTPGPGEKSYVTDADGNVTGISVGTTDGRIVVATETGVDVNTGSVEIEMPVDDLSTRVEGHGIPERPTLDTAGRPTTPFQTAPGPKTIARIHNRGVVAAYRNKEIAGVIRTGVPVVL